MSTEDQGKKRGGWTLAGRGAIGAIIACYLPIVLGALGVAGLTAGGGTAGLGVWLGWPGALALVAAGGYIVWRRTRETARQRK